MARMSDCTPRRSSGHQRGARTINGTSVTVHVALTFRRRHGRKVLQAPDGEIRVTATSRPSGKVTPVVRALARAFRWRKLIETGAVGTVHEIAAAGNINASYVSRVLRLTLLPPEIVETISAGMPEASLPLGRLLMPFPVEWERSAVSIGPK